MNETARKKIIQEYYSKRSKDYDKQKSRTWKSTTGFGDEVINAVSDALAVFKGKRLLEVGVGSGRNALPLFEKIKPWLVGLDLSREMLETAKTKMRLFKRNLNLVLGDADHLPFTDEAFDALFCMSTMHYFVSPASVMHAFSRILKEKGIFLCGDLTVHESDDERFFENLERTLSKAHAQYHKPSEMKKMMENCGFRVSNMETFTYKKSYQALMEDKGDYFGVPHQTFDKYLQETSTTARQQYSLSDVDLTLFYTVIVAKKENKNSWFDAEEIGVHKNP
ncbi:MAG TPA: class I SAM-dependent methyltransferase [Candidatus Bathyarchaeia archaeon]|nr:class I SAM-dependent methyltransferase [Candidatus Bathyarchaeia archaeon]